MFMKRTTCTSSLIVPTLRVVTTHLTLRVYDHAEAARLAGGSGFEIATASKPDGYKGGMCGKSGSAINHLIVPTLRVVTTHLTLRVYDHAEAARLAGGSGLEVALRQADGYRAGGWACQPPVMFMNRTTCTSSLISKLCL
ncbi:hypothetical protein ACI2KS_15170 [Pseudomonas sp. NPDC087358]|uniref:hypothetical protein n=1 Tax=Pseudomonas sp. NPDC087358 TaxID=3364439 RepID=UPI00384AF7F3